MNRARSTTWPLAILSLLLALAAFPPAATAAAPPFALPGAFGLTPARRHVVGTPGTALTPTTVVNTSSSAYRVTVFPVVLTQDLTGAFNFTQTPQANAAARRVLRVGPDQFVLPPGGERQVALRWNALPPGVSSMAMGVVFQGVAEHQSGPVNVVARLLSVNFLSLPGAIPISGRFTRLVGEQFGHGVLRFLPRVQNTGQRVWAPTRGHLVIRNSAGTTVFHTAWTGDVIIPGAQRDFPIDVTQALPAGSYTATAQMNFGPGSIETISTPFTLVGPNQLPTPTIAVHSFNATAQLGGPATVTGVVASVGTAPASVTVRLTLVKVDPDGTQRSLATAALPYLNLAPGSSRRVSRQMGGNLALGSYEAIATWTAPDGSTHTLEASFSALAGRSLLSQFWFLVTKHVKLVVALLVLLLVAVTAMALLLKRRQRDLEAELDDVIGVAGPHRPDPSGPPHGPRLPRTPRPPRGPSSPRPTEPPPVPAPERSRAADRWGDGND